jgi:hypothetical protein
MLELKIQKGEKLRHFVGTKHSKLFKTGKIVQIKLNSIYTDDVTEETGLFLSSTKDKIQQNKASNSIILGCFVSLHILKKSKYDKEIEKKQNRNIYLWKRIFWRSCISITFAL